MTRVLYVDDEPDIREIAELALGLDPAFEVRTAASGAEALALLAGWRADVALLDVMMPEMDGPTLLARMRATPELADIPVIFVSARTDVKDQGKGLALGAVDYITKPFSTPLVLARLRNHLALYDQRRALEDQVRQRTDELHNTRRQVIRRLSRAMEYREGGLTHRVLRVSHYVKLLATQIGNRNGFSKAMLTGRTAPELSERSTAATEIYGLRAELGALLARL